MDEVFQKALECKYQGESLRITYGLVEQAELFLNSHGYAIGKYMPIILRNLNPHIVLPSKYGNLTRKLEKCKQSAAKDDIIPFILPIDEPYLGPYTQEISLNCSQLKSQDGLFEFPAIKCVKVGLILELERFRQKNGFSWEIATHWLQSLHIEGHNSKAIQMSWSRLYTAAQKSRSHKVGVKNDFLDETYQPPVPKPTPKQVLIEKLENPPQFTTNNPLMEMAQHTGSVIGEYSNKMEGKVTRRDLKISALQIELGSTKTKLTETEKERDESLSLNYALEQENYAIEREMHQISSDLVEEQEKRASIEKVYKPKNVMRREETKMRNIKILEAESKEQKKQLGVKEQEINDLKSANEDLKSNLEIEKKLKRNAQKLASKYRNKTSPCPSDPKVKQLSQQVTTLENENLMLQETLDEFIHANEVTTFQGGRYNDTIRQVCHILLSEGVSMSKTETVIRTVLSKLGNMECGRLPSKSTLVNMAAECDVLSKIHVGQLILDEAHTTLHLDGTRKKFREYSTFQVSTTDGGSKSLGFKEMVAGATSDYMEATKDLFHEISVYLSNVSDTESQEVTEARLLKNIMNTQTDRHVVNKSYREQLKEYKSSMLPLIMQDFNSLSPKEVSDAVRINGLMCGMHAVHGVGKVTKDALKDFENIACPEQEFRGFQKSDSRTYSLLWEISKAFTQAHDYQKAGVAHYFEAHLTSVEQKNHLISLRGERINALFVMGAASFFHKQHILEFIAAHNTEKNKSKLLTSIQDLELPIIQVEMRSLGIMGKLLTGPLIRLIEAPQKHILHLNDTWLHVIRKLEEFAVNSSPLLEGIEFVPGSPVSKDEVYHSLFAPQPPEIEDMTGDCLRLISCNATILLKRQLQDQLPGGIFYQPSEELLHETATAPAHNIVSERDFAQLDSQLRNKPAISTVSMSGLIAYSNNRTPEYLDELSEEERHNIITKAIKQARINRQLNHQRKKEIKVKRIEEMQRKKEKREADAKIKEARKIEATNDLMNYGGLWCTTESVGDRLNSLNEKDKKKAVLAQLKYRRLVLNPSINRALFHVSSQGKAKGLDELVGNLKEIVSLSGAECSNQAAKTPKSISATERKDKIDEAVKRKHTENHSDDDSDDESDDDPDKPTKQKLPDLVGKSIMHRWEENGEEKWVYGKVRRAKGNITDIHCEFVVEYNDGVFDVPLYEDFNSGDLTIVWYMYTKPDRSSKVHVISYFFSV